MSTVKYHIASVVIGLCVCTILAATTKGCNRKLCPGPLYYYEELGCTPIYDNAASCCPTRYNCDNWKNLPEDKCLVNGHVYGMDEVLRPSELPDPCSRCICQYGRFTCSGPLCAGPSVRKPGCSYTSSLLHCCEIVEICADGPVTCVVDGKSYKLGETFRPLAEPMKTCTCAKGYTGENSENFCVSRKPSWCGNVVHETSYIRNHCAPIYKKDHSLQTDCNDSFECHENGDYILHRPDDVHFETTVDSQKNSENRCVLGNSTMRIGEEFRGSNIWSGPVRCICEVPPVPTCRYVE